MYKNNIWVLKIGVDFLFLQEEKSKMGFCIQV